MCKRDYREWSEMKADGIEIETMQEYVDEVRGFHDFDEPEPPDPYDDPDYFREEDEPDTDYRPSDDHIYGEGEAPDSFYDEDEPHYALYIPREVWGQE